MPLDTDLTLLIARGFLSAIFLFSGVTKALAWAGTVEEMKSFGLPMPSMAAAVTVTVQLVGGLSVLLGVSVQAGAVLLAAFTVVATMIGHGFWRFDGGERRQHLIITLEHLAIVGGFAVLAVSGPGGYTL